MRVNELSAIDGEVCQNAENGILESFPSRSSVGSGVSVAVNRLVPRENDVWLSLLLQLPRGCSADTEVRCEIALIFGYDDSQVGVQVGGGALYARSNVGAVLGNDEIVPLGDNIRRELGDDCGGSRQQDVMNANDVRLDLPRIWLN